MKFWQEACGHFVIYSRRFYSKFRNFQHVSDTPLLFSPSILIRCINLSKLYKKNYKILMDAFYRPSMSTRLFRSRNQVYFARFVTDFWKKKKLIFLDPHWSVWLIAEFFFCKNGIGQWGQTPHVGICEKTLAKRLKIGKIRRWRSKFELRFKGPKFESEMSDFEGSDRRIVPNFRKRSSEYWRSSFADDRLQE